MERFKTYNRTINLFDKYTKFIESINTEDIESNFTLYRLIELKSILSDINNIMTLISTRSIATKILSILSLNNEDRERILNVIDNQKPNSNGFDIRIDSPIKILVEVKCNSLIHNKKFGAAQINAILDDARKLRLESSRNIKVRKFMEFIYSRIIPDNHPHFHKVVRPNVQFPGRFSFSAPRYRGTGRKSMVNRLS